ncbi:MAG: patatin-like phospholipase family protein [Candidatus Nanopelagicales bacterium]
MNEETKHAASTLDIGVIIAGAGARGAYEAGLLAHLLPEIASRTQSEGLVARFAFLGTSAGSLNTALIASRAPHVTGSNTPEQVRSAWEAVMDEVTAVWRHVGEGSVLGPLPSGRLIGAITRVIPHLHLPLASALNVRPLVELAHDPSIVDWEALHERVIDGSVLAVGAAATARDGRTVLFLDRHDPSLPPERDTKRDIDYVDTPDGLQPEHVLASSAIPAVFPARKVTQPADWAGWYYDGGVRLNTPLKPAITLGLDHLVIVGTHPDRYDRSSRPDPTAGAPEIDESLIPVVNQLLVDQLVQDLQTLRSRNTKKPSKLIRYLFAGPEDFDTLAELSCKRATGLGAIRVLRNLLAGPARGELSSYLLFDAGYLGASIDAGRKRAAAPGVLPDGGPVPWRT